MLLISEKPYKGSVLVKFRLLVLTCLGLLGSASLAAVEVIKVGVTEAANSTTISGTVIPLKEVTFTAQLSGRVVFIAGIEGTAFGQGSVLVKISDDDLRAKRRQLQAQMSNAQSALQNARVQYGRELYSPRSESPGTMPGFGLPIMMDNVFTKPMGSVMGYGEPGLERHADLFSAQSGISQAQASLLQAQSQLQELDTRIRDAQSIGPFDGIILKKMVEVGDTVQPGQALLSFGHVKYLRLRSDVPARLVGNLQKGQLVSVALDNGVKTRAKVAQVAPIADATNYTVEVEFDLPKNIRATPGMYAELDVPSIGVSEGNVTISIPVTALIRGRSLPAVLVKTESGRSSVRLVRLGQRDGAGNVVVLSGLRSGQEVYDHPPSGVRSGWQPSSDDSANKSD